jgi:nuclear GTP-binding protein
VPKENLESWVKYLRGELPTIAFKSSTQNQSTRLGHSKVTIEKSSDAQLNTSKCVGASTLMSLLSNYCRNKDVKTSIRVGIVGLPNVGKSSLINSLKRNRACSVGAMPGKKLK